MGVGVTMPLAPVVEDAGLLEVAVDVAPTAGTGQLRRHRLPSIGLSNQHSRRHSTRRGCAKVMAFCDKTLLQLP